MHKITLESHRRLELIDVTPILAQFLARSRLDEGVLTVFVPHTTAAVTINENADPDVPADLETSFSAIAPEDFPYRHVCEGPDDMPAHVKAALLGSSVTVPQGRSFFHNTEEA